MKLSKKMQDALVAQVNAEFDSAYIYLGMAATLTEMNYSGMATWMKLQAKEEIEHGMKIFTYIHERGGNVSLPAISAVKKSWKTPLDVFSEALKHEEMITKRIEDLVDTATKEKDKATHVFLHSFITEQVEEEANATEIVDKIKMTGKSNSGLLYLDKALAKRGEE